MTKSGIQVSLKADCSRVIGPVYMQISAQYTAGTNSEGGRSVYSIIVSCHKINPEYFKDIFKTGKYLYVIIFFVYV